MKKTFTIYLLILVFINLYSFNSVIPTEQKNKSRFTKDHFIVKLRDIKSLSSAGNTASLSSENLLIQITKELKINLKKIKKLFPLDKNNEFSYNKFELDNFYLIYFDGYKDIQEICREFEKNDNIEFAEPDYVGEAAGEKTFGNKIMNKPNDEFFKRQWGLNNEGSTRTTLGREGKVGADVNALKGWEITTGSEDVIVGVLDSGVKLNHPDLKDRIWVNTKETKNGKDDDGNGYADDIHGWNFAYENSNLNDDGGHGTNIAGTIGASTNNSIGYAGMDQKCKLMICKNLDNDNLGEYSWWASSLYYASNNGAKVINMSEGGYDYSKTLQTAIEYAYNLGCLIVSSMMNKNNGDNYYPASLKNVLAIGATDTDDSRCKQFTWGGGSNWGKHIGVVAPGNRIYGLDYRNNNDYNVYWSGTSQATAYVSGIASLLLSQNPNRTNSDLKEIIISTAKDQVGDPREDKPGWDEYHGFGRVDVYEALNYDNTAGRNREDKPGEEIKETNKDKEVKEKENLGKAKAVDRDAKDTDNNSEDRKAKKVDR